MTTWGPLQHTELERALEDFDDGRVEQLCRQYVEHLRSGAALPRPASGTAVLRALRRKQRTGELRLVAEALLARDPDWPSVVHRYAVALLDEGSAVAAEALLATIVVDPAAADAEVQGALGRLHKLRYVTPGLVPESRRAGELRAAIDTYRMSYEQDPAARHYAGINAVALLRRAETDGVDVGGPTGLAGELADRVLADIAGTLEPDTWACASAAEACIALNRHADASTWLAQYLDSESDAFANASTLRQFEQVWRLDATTSPGRELLPMLRARLLLAAGGTCSLAPAEYTAGSMDRFDDLERRRESQPDGHLERVLGYDRFQSLGFLRDAVDRCRSVAMVQTRYGDGHGTAFVLDGRQIRDDWPERVLVTNAHVVPDEVPVQHAWAAFHGIDDSGSPHVVRVGRMLWQSPRGELDACFLDLADPLSPDAKPIPFEDKHGFPALGSNHQVRAYVIGHPLGQPSIRLSLHDTLLLDSDDRFAHYRSPTMDGSSGSPVFDATWQVIALHHGWVGAQADGGRAEANEGIRFDRLLAAVRSG